LIIEYFFEKLKVINLYVHQFPENNVPQPQQK